MKLKRENIPNILKIKKAKISYGDDLDHHMHDANHTEYIPDGKEHHEGKDHETEDEHHGEHYGDGIFTEVGEMLDHPDFNYEHHNFWAYIVAIFLIFCCLRLVCFNWYGYGDYGG